MFLRREPQNLLPLDDAKALFKKALAPRITAYEERLKKPMLQRGIDYLRTSFGEAGYKRTQAFLKDMAEEKISSTEKLIALTAKKEYLEKGSAMPLLLQRTVLTVCGFKDEHIRQISDEMDIAVLRGSGMAAGYGGALPMISTHDLAVATIYDRIIASPDFGEGYLRSFATRGLSSSSIGRRHQQPGF